jgi:membrane protease YdiL (CAAX protease family)
MNHLKLFVQRNPLVAFFVLAYALSWWPWLLSDANPFYPLFPLGPLVAALFLTVFASGRAGLKGLLARVVQWRVNLRWYGVVLLLPATLGLFAFGLNVLLGAPMPAADRFPALASILPVFLLQLVFIQVGEEVGWRGFALPRLLEGRSALAASLILGLLWTGWHLPAYVTGTIAVILVPFPLVSTFLFTWLYQHTKGSVLIAILFHSLINTVAAALLPLFSGPFLEQVLWLFVGVYVLAAAAVVVIAGRNLRRQPASPLGVAPTV